MQATLRTLGLLLPAMAQAAAPADPASATSSPARSCATPRRVPCWLAEYDGELYFLTLQTDVSAPVNPPWLGHRVLVEGRRKDAPRICGGIVLEPVRLSVIAGAGCFLQHSMLPAEERYNLTFEPPRPPGPSAGRLAFNTLPMPVQPTDVKREPREYTLPYDFNGLVNFKHPFQLAPLLDVAKAMPAKRVEITGHRGAVLLSDGTVLQEQADIARRRAEQVAELLRGAGLTAPAYEVRWVDGAPAPNGVDDHGQRRVDITIRP